MSFSFVSRKCLANGSCGDRVVIKIEPCARDGNSYGYRILLDNPFPAAEDHCSYHVPLTTDYCPVQTAIGVLIVPVALPRARLRGTTLPNS
jgi:hypothetical protein